MVVGVLTHCALLHCGLKTTQWIEQCSLIQELDMFKLDYNTADSTKNICIGKVKDAIDHSTVIRGFKTFCSGYKNLHDKASLVRLKTLDSEAVLQVIEANLVGSTRRISGKHDISQSSVVYPLYNLSKYSQLLTHSSKYKIYKFMTKFL